ncbi:MAG TPA: TlpA disulfide reductase family protein [Bacteroidia bacterium]|nr:TlpA disulfide reductase family protein [Bacteroidia bacterium]
MTFKRINLKALKRPKNICGYKFILMLFLLFSFKINSQDCFSDCLKRLKIGQDTMFRSMDQIKKNVEDSLFSPLSVNKNIIKNLIGCQFPNTPLRSVNDKTISISKFKNKPVFIHFWFTSCRPCIAEIETINSLQKEFEGKAYFLAINTDDMLTLKEFLKEHKYNSYQTNISKNKAMNDFCVIGGYPTCIILDSHNKVSAIWSGGNINPLEQKDFYLQVKKELENNLSD